MSKVKISTIIYRDNEQFLNDCVGLKQKNKIIFFEKDIKNEITIDKDLILNRENSEFKMSLIFRLNENTKNRYLLKELNNEFLINIKTTRLDILENKIEVEYMQDLEKVFYRLEWK